MKRFVIFGGTTEGRTLAGLLCGAGCRVELSVATPYGRQLVEPHRNLSVHCGRLTGEEMARWFALLGEPITAVLDATHPYAQEVSRNIREACAQAGLPCLRLLRESAGEAAGAPATWVGSPGEAAAFLARQEGNILLTTGSKDLEAFLGIPGFRERVFPRILPVAQTVARCLELGYRAQNLICMQGPFTLAMNLATLEQYNIRWLVTKESGRAGGFWEKCDAARQAGVPVVAIGRPDSRQGYSMEELLAQLSARYQIWLPEQEGERAAQSTPPGQSTGDRGFFPLFFPLKGRTVQVFGGGAVALRRVKSLLPTGCALQVDAPDLLPELRELARGNPSLTLRCQPYRPGGWEAQLVLACTNDSRVNQAIRQECLERQIPCNRADRREECDFYFPAIVRQGGLTLGLCSSGASPARVRRAACLLRGKMGALLEELEETEDTP